MRTAPLPIAALSLCLASAAAAGEVSITGKVNAAGAQPVIVYIERAGVAAPPPPPPLRVAQRGMQFLPAVSVALQGQRVDFPNEDKTYHNIFSVTQGNEFDLGMYRAGASKSVNLKEPGEVDVYCNIHPDMAAKVLVLQNGYYTEVAADGSYALKDVPPGSYTLVAWAATHLPQRRKVDVKAGQTARVLFGPLRAREEKTAHLNKNGEQYGRYK